MNLRLPNYSVGGPVRPNVIARLERDDGRTVSVAVLERSRGDREAIVSIMTIRTDGSVAGRVELKGTDLAALEEAIRVCRAATKANDTKAGCPGEKEGERP